MRAGGRLAVLFLALFVAACGDDDDSRPQATPTATVAAATSTATIAATPTRTASAVPSATTVFTATLPPSATPTVAVTATPAVGAVALFNVDAAEADNPFPSDRMLDENGHVIDVSARLRAYVPDEARFDDLRAYVDDTAAQLTALTGFSTFAPVQVLLDRPPATGPLVGGSAYLLRAEAPFELQPINAVGLAAGTAGADLIELQPTVPLDAKTSYVYIVTDAARDADGNRLRRDPDLTAALGDDVPALREWRAGLLPALQYLRDDLGVATESIVAIDRFTTQPTTDDLASIATLLDDGTLPAAAPDFDTPVPDLPIGIFAEGTPQFRQLVGTLTSPTLAAVAVGTFASYDFRTDGSFDPATVSGATTPGTNPLDFYVTIPKGTPPEGGWPVTLFGHGLGQSGRDTIGIAAALGDYPSIVIGISAVSHGRRGNFLEFFDFLHPFTTRDNFRQSVADMLQVVEMVRRSSAPPFDDIDRDRIRYFGLSLGGIMGTIFMGHVRSVEIGMLSVPGGGLAGIIRSPLIGDLLQPLLATAVGVPRDDPFFPVVLHNFIRTSQWALDAGDPVNVAPFVIDPERRLPGVSPKRILMHEGMIDTVVPNETTENLVRAMRLPDAAPNGCRNDDGCNGIWRFVMSDYGLAPDSGHLVTFIVPQAGAQARQFLASDGTEIIVAEP
jgi:hypothetical protein